MSNLDRRTQKIFGSGASAQQISAFGTAKDTSPTYITDLNTGMDSIQNSTYLQGWTPSLVDDLAPFLEDSNGLWYMITRQLAYIYQDGVAEYDANTNYKKGSLAKVIDSNGNVIIYKSTVNDNKANSVTNTNYWKIYLSDSNLANYEIGVPQPTLSDTLLTNEVWLEGQTVYRNTYVNLFNIYGTTYGAGDSVNTFVLPDFRNRVIWGTSQGNFGYISAGLPNITGKGMLGTNATLRSGQVEGCVYEYGTKSKDIYRGVANASTSDNDPCFGIDASLSNTIYGNSSTVQPPAVIVRFKTRYY